MQGCIELRGGLLMDRAIADRIREFIRINYKSYAEFARVVGTDRSRITSYVKGRTSPALKNLKSLYDAGLNTEWLMTGQGNMYANNDTGVTLSKEFIKKFTHYEKIHKEVKNAKCS